MSLYSITSVGRTIKHYATYGLICAALGMYIGSCSAKSSTGSARKDTRSRTDISTENRAEYRADTPTDTQIFDLYTAHNTYTIDERGLESRLRE